jgi:hypothetical protein
MARSTDRGRAAEFSDPVAAFGIHPVGRPRFRFYTIFHVKRGGAGPIEISRPPSD